MYKLKLLMFMVILMTNIGRGNLNVFAQGIWEIVRNPEWQTHLKSVFFVDLNNGWAVGTDGTIIHTNDGGTAWTSQTSGTTNDLFSVHFVNVSTGWVVGDEGIVLRTANGGTNWEAVASNTTDHLDDVFFLDETHAWIVGGTITVRFSTKTGFSNLRHTNVVLRTINGGASWLKSTNLGSGRLLHSVHFADARYGWAVGYGYALLGPWNLADRNIILRSTDGGVTWSSQTIGPLDHLFDVQAVGQNSGWIAGDNGVLLHSTNGGIDWTERISNTSSKLLGLHFANAEQGWIVGDDGLILHTEDGGDKWSAQTSGTTNDLESVYFVDQNTGWAVGGSGIVLKYTVLTTRFWADIDGDHDVDVVDIQIVAGKWNTKVGDPDYDPRCDVDNEGQGDGDIDVVDIQLVAGWWNKPLPGSGASMLTKVCESILGNPTLRVNSPIPSSESASNYYIDVTVENAVNLGAFQFDIVSNDIRLKIDGVELGSFLNNGQNKFVPLRSEMDIERNRLTLGAYSYGESLGASGSGVLVRIRVSSENGDVSPIALENIKLVDSRGNLLPVNDTINAINDRVRTEVTSQSFTLNQNYPNPFNSETVIRYHLPKGDKVTLKIYNLLGQEIRTLVNDQKQAGYFEIQWDGKDEFGTEVPSGVYIYRIKIGSFIDTKKMFLLR